MSLWRIIKTYIFLADKLAPILYKKYYSKAMSQNKKNRSGTNHKSEPGKPLFLVESSRDLLLEQGRNESVYLDGQPAIERNKEVMSLVTSGLDLKKAPDSRWVVAPSPVWLRNH